MAVTKCPKCNRRIRVPDDVGDAKLRCGNCGKLIELGAARQASDTQGEDESPGIEGPPPGEHDLGDLVEADRERVVVPTRKRRPKVSPAYAIIVGVGVLALAATGYTFWYMITHQRIEVRNEYGKIVFEGWVPRDRAEEIIAQYQHVDEETDAPDVVPDVAGGESPDVVARGDEKLLVTVRKAGVAVDGASGHVTGELISRTDRGLSSAQVLVEVFDREGNSLAEPTTTVRWIPARTNIPFSVSYEKIPPERLGHAEATGLSPVELDPRDVCWQIPEEQCRTRPTGSTVVLTGEAANREQSTLMNVEIFCDAFTREGVFIDTYKGALNEGDSLQGGASRGFRVVIEPGTNGYATSEVGRLFIRMVGTQLR